MTSWPLPVVVAPDERALLERLAPHIDDAMLHEIAAADYGNDAAENLALLRRMRDEDHVPENAWIPMEAVELVRWSEPDERGWRPGGEGRRGHLMRAFCAGWVMRVAGQRERYVLAAGNETAVQLLGSLERLELGLWREAAGLLAWFVPRWSAAGNADEDALLGVALLHCALRTGVADAALVALCEWIAAREQAIGTSFQSDQRWGLRASHANFKRHEWHALGAKLAALDLSGRDPALRDWVRLIGESLAGN